MRDSMHPCLLQSMQMSPEERPTIERVRLTIGRGTINRLLDAWWSRLAGRLDAGPAALHQLPEPVLFAVEDLWLQALEQARKRVADCE